MEYVDGPVTQVYGAGKELSWQLGYGHLGEDKGVPVGTTARTIADGVVIFAGWARDCPANLKNEILVMGDAPGIFVWILHQDQNGPWESLTCHLSDTRLNAGNRVRRGDKIGESGNTGLSTGPHTHYETFTRPCSNVPPFSRYNPRLQIQNEDQRFGAGTAAPAVPAAPPAPAANVRHVGMAAAKQRNWPRLDAPVVRIADPDTDEAFTGWSTGQWVNGNDIWFRDSVGFIHSSAFTSQSTAGLPRQQVNFLDPEERIMGGIVSFQRALPYKASTKIRDIQPHTIERFTKWCHGEMVVIPGEAGVRSEHRSDIWFGDKDGWVWKGGISTGEDTTGLPEVPAPKSAPSNQVPPKNPEPNTYTFVKAFDLVTEVRPAAPGNFELGNFPAPRDVKSIFIHQFNADEVADNASVNKVTVHLDSVVSTFQGTGRIASAHFGVEGVRVVQFLALTDRAYAQGSPANGEGWSIETYGAQDPVTMATVAKLIKKLEELGGKKQLRRHKEAMATKCGNGVDLAAYRKLVDNLAATPIVNPGAPAPVPTPVTPAPKPDSPAEATLRSIQQQITKYFAERK